MKHKNKSLTDDLNDWTQLQFLLKHNIPYDIAYKRVYGVDHPDYLKEQEELKMPTLGDIMDTIKIITDDFMRSIPERKVVGIIEGDSFSEMAPEIFIEPYQPK